MRSKNGIFYLKIITIYLLIKIFSAIKSVKFEGKEMLDKLSILELENYRFFKMEGFYESYIRKKLCREWNVENI